MNFEFLDLRAFIAVADLGSFHRAAKSLNLSQPALSRRIQKLWKRAWARHCSSDRRGMLP